MKQRDAVILLHLGVMILLLVSCKDDPVTPAPAPPPTFAEQVAAWNPRIIVEEPIVSYNPSLEIYTVTPCDTITDGSVSFRIDSTNVPDSVKWSLGEGSYTTLHTTITHVPIGVHEIEAVLRKRFVSIRENIDTLVERTVQRTFVSLDNSHSLAIGKWVPVDPSEQRIDTLRVIYMGVIPGTQDSILRNFVLGVTKGCDTTYFRDTDMYMSLRRFAVNFERGSTTLDCQQVFGELALSSSNVGIYRVSRDPSSNIQSIAVRRVE